MNYSKVSPSQGNTEFHREENNRKLRRTLFQFVVKSIHPPTELPLYRNNTPTTSFLLHFIKNVIPVVLSVGNLFYKKTIN